MTMQIYHYHPETGELVGVGEADENPLDPENPLMPAYSTSTPAPQAEQGTVALFLDSSGLSPRYWQSGAWVVKADYREVPLFSTADGAPYAPDGTYSGLGDLPQGVTTQPRPSPAHTWIDGSWKLDANMAANLRRSAALSERAGRMDAARDAMDPLQFAADLGEATDTEVAALTAWKRYVVGLNRLDLSADPIVWPSAPST